jgi:hypothetical protein
VGSDLVTGIQATLIFQSPSPTQLIDGFSFSNLNAPGEWLSGFILGFTATVASGNPNVTIVASQDQIDSGLTGPSNGTAVTDTQTIGTLTLNGLSVSNEMGQIGYAGVTSVTTSSLAIIPSGNLLIRYDQSLSENVAPSPVPEPASYSLLGASLACLAALRRKNVGKELLVVPILSGACVLLVHAHRLANVKSPGW